MATKSHEEQNEFMKLKFKLEEASNLEIFDYKSLKPKNSNLKYALIA